ncbi:hypothetical protein VTK73DRAFT_6841 [Phialemonium thermophilum]|uniref:beta-glucosidase n=1 Tax=Phialemonium thermophilum TaxID=223376 RepID=A0ABR3Y8T4_9PEZI
MERRYPLSPQQLPRPSWRVTDRLPSSSQSHILTLRAYADQCSLEMQLSFLHHAALIGTAIAADTPFVGFPSPWTVGGPGWDDAIAKARAFVSNLTLVEKVNLTTGTGWESDVCVGMTGSVPRLGFRGFCLQDGPLGVRYSSSLPWRERTQRCC